MLRVAINGFGRIGKSAFKIALDKHADKIEIVAINDLSSPAVHAPLLQRDSTYGRWEREVSSDDTNLIIDGKKYPMYATKDPATLPWKDLGVDVVIECTGRFTNPEGAKLHIAGGAKRVVISAPGKDGVDTFVIGVNHTDYKGQEIVDNASCTTNCIAPIVAIIDNKFGIEKALMTTIHAVTAEQNLVDGAPPGGKKSDLRRARSGLVNIIPTSTGAAVATAEVLPQMKGIFDGRSLRVPVIVGSISDITFVLKKKTTVEEVNEVIKKSCESPMYKGIVAWSEDPIVSSDIIGRSESAVVDLPLTQIVDGDLLKIFAWYDNEYGYSNRLVEQVINVGK